MYKGSTRKLTDALLQKTSGKALKELDEAKCDKVCEQSTSGGLCLLSDGLLEDAQRQEAGGNEREKGGSRQGEAEEVQGDEENVCGDGAGNKSDTVDTSALLELENGGRPSEELAEGVNLLDRLSLGVLDGRVGVELLAEAVHPLTKTSGSRGRGRRGS